MASQLQMALQLSHTWFIQSLTSPLPSLLMPSHGLRFPLRLISLTPLMRQMRLLAPTWL